MSTATITQRAQAPVAGEATSRLPSIDVLRGLTILVMIFVNDVAGVTGTPGWMKHIEPPNADGMTFVDVVFPAFLFIVGLAIPLGLDRRMQRDGRAAALRHVLARTIGLLVIGVFMVNTGGYSDGALLPRQVWTLLLYTGVALVWLAPTGNTPATMKRARLLRTAGIVLLVAVALLFRSDRVESLVELRPSWYGILGLIGWAYLVSCGVYLAARGRLVPIGVGVVALYGYYLAYRAGRLPVIPYLNAGSMLGSHGALTLSGTFAAVAMFQPTSRWRTHRQRAAFAVAYGAVMALAAVTLHAFNYVHPMFIINKIAATPAWCLWSAAITIWIWAGIYLLLDVRRTVRLPLLEHSGQNALLAYILAPVFYAAVSLLSMVTGIPNGYALAGQAFTAGFMRSLLFAFFVIWVAAVLRRRGFVLKL